MSKKAVNKRSFDEILTEVVGNWSALRDRLQDLLVFAMVQAGSQNYTFINRIINADLKGSDQRAVQAYIEDHCDVQLLREDGVLKFKNAKTKGFKYVAPTKSWFDYAPTAEPKAIDEQTSVISLIARLHKGLHADKDAKAYIRTGHKKATKQIIEHLSKTPGLDREKVKAAMGKA